MNSEVGWCSGWRHASCAKVGEFAIKALGQLLCAPVSEPTLDSYRSFHIELGCSTSAQK